MKKGIVLFLLIVLSVVVCKAISFTGSKDSGVREDKRLSVYTTFYPMYDFAKKIGGNKINLTNLIPAGVEPHDWEPTPREIAQIGKADVFIYNGAGMEPWVAKVLSMVQTDKLSVLEASKGFKLIKVGRKDTYDPHVWLNPRLAQKQLEAIKNIFVKKDPINKKYYEKNYMNYAKEIDVLNNEYRETVKGCKKREIVVAHEAFGYICAAYGLKQIGIEGLNAEAEPTPAKMAEIIRFAKKHNVKVIFFEELLNPKVAKTIAAEVGARVEVLNPLEGLKEKDIKAGKEYFSVMRDNLIVLKKALE